MRELSGYNPTAALEVVRWPVREALLAYQEHLVGLATDAFRHAQLLWQVRVAFGGKDKPPRVPEILRGEVDEGRGDVTRE